MGQELEPHKPADKGLGEGGWGGTQMNQVLAFCMPLERVREKGNREQIIREGERAGLPRAYL